MNKFINSCLLIVFLIFFIKSIKSQQPSNAKIQDISTISKSQYGDPNCFYTIDLLIDNIDTGFIFESISIDSFKYSNPILISNETLYNSNNNNGSIIFRITFSSAVTDFISGLGELNLNLTFNNGLSQRRIGNKTIEFYCEKPPSPIFSLQNKFLMSANRISLVATFKVTNWVRSNLPQLSPQVSILGLSSAVCTPYIGQDFYTLTIVVTKNFNMTSTYKLPLYITNWSNSNYYDLTVNGPLEVPKYLVDGIDLNVFPPINAPYGMHVDNTLYAVSNIESSLLIDYVYTTSSSSILSRYSIIVSGNGSFDSMGNIRSTWINPFIRFNYGEPTFSVNVLSQPVWNSLTYSMSGVGYTQKQGTFQTPSTKTINGTDKIQMVLFLSNDIATDSNKIQISFNVINSDGSIKYIRYSQITYPYGFSSVSLSNAVFKVTTLMSSSVLDSKFKSDLFSTNSNQPARNQNYLSDLVPPIVSNFKITSLGNGFFLIEASVSENNGSGFFEISLNNNNNNQSKSITLLSCFNFKSGNIYNDSTYQRIFKPSINSIGIGYKFYVFDQAGNSVEIKQQYFNGYNQPIIKIPSSYYEPFGKWVITHFNFETPNVDLEINGIWNAAYLMFNSSKGSFDPFINYPYLMLTPYKLGQNIYFYKAIPFIWNSTAELYQATFFLPSGLAKGEIQYKIINPMLENEYYSDYMYSLFGNLSKLTSNSLKFKSTPPIVKKLIVEGSPITISSSSTLGLLGKFVLSFEEDDLEIGYITVASFNGNQMVKRYFNFTIKPELVLSSYPDPNSYSIEFPITCISTQYQIIYAKFINKQGYISEFSKYDSLYSFDDNLKESVPVNPFFKLYTVNPLANFVVQCQNPTYSTLTLVSFNVPNTIDVGLLNEQIINVAFTIQDTINGIDFDQKPMVYLICGLYGKEMLSFEVDDISKSDETFALFSASVVVPYGFAYPNPIFVEIFGVVNKAGYVSGWASNDIETLKSSQSNIFSSSKISTSMTLLGNSPFISSSIESLNNNNILVIYGFNLLKNCTISRRYNSIDTNTLTDLFVLSANGNVMEIGIPIKINQNYLITVTSNEGKVSNEYLIEMIVTNFKFQSIILTPTPTPPNNFTFSPSSTPSPTQSITPPPPTTNAPQKCVGTPVCGGELQGYCSGSGCICYSPWMGVGCLSKTIIIPPPVIDPFSPSINLTAPINKNEVNQKTTSLLGIISIISIRELNIKGNPIKTHKLTGWTLSKISDIENYYSSDILTSNSAGEQITCKISVSTIWYQSLKNITFAGQQLIMNPSTLKYNINITTYAFENSLNTLELVISATAQSDKIDDSTCTDQKFGETTDDQNYVQLTVNDHSLYGRFVRRGIIDGSKIVGISNVKLNDLSVEDTYYTSQSYIGLRIPQFKYQIELDPDFSILVNTDSTNSNCKDKSNGTSKSVLIGIVVGCVGGAVVLTVALVFIFKYKYQIRNFQSSIKLSKRK